MADVRTYREPVDVWPMIEKLKKAVEERRDAGRLREGDKLSSLHYYEMDAEECKMFLQRLNGFHIPDTSFQLTWVDTRQYFEVTPRTA